MTNGKMNTVHFRTNKTPIIFLVIHKPGETSEGSHRRGGGWWWLKLEFQLLLYDENRLYGKRTKTGPCLRNCK